jgi:hypothetical protein
VCYLFVTMNECRNKDIEKLCHKWLKNMTTRACASLLTAERFQDMKILPSGRCTGFMKMVRQAGRHVPEAWCGAWKRLHSCGEVESAYDDESAAMVDVVTVCALWLKDRCRRKFNVLQPASRQAWRKVTQGLQQWLAEHMDRYVLNVYVSAHEVRTPPPAMRGVGERAGPVVGDLRRAAPAAGG